MIGTLFTTRRPGVSVAPYDELNLGGAVGDDPAAVRVNRTMVAERIGVPTDRMVWMRQVHSSIVRVVDGTERDLSAECDGVVTTTPGLVLGVLAADCVPILAGDPAHGVIGAAHAGRRGAAGGIGRRLVEAMSRAGADPGAVTVWLGPAICGGCYEVPPNMRDDVERTLPGSVCVTDRGTAGLDLRAGLRRQFERLGVRAVAVDSRCTHTDPDLFSHRRGAPTGRQAGLIWRLP
ncbi:MAG TPA: peptidoglycan editing factor PgeF [Nakamurella sp.]